ncbi:hypothetical protein QJS10_CPB19g01598 [Acorus calamus]|uniref:Calmodulin-binding heat-shock protein n=1 Tax=Acorus calamus TaxID=4465 RepID=A0AAV9CI90_ACOCL|nr:hypothetical protein QJS10_CPB19g01598 [Acorus calamus]
MAGAGVVECALCIGCTRWAYKRCTYIGAYDSESWPSLTSSDDFECVPRLCRLILAAYEDDISNPKYAPPGGYGVNPEWVVRRVDYDQTQGRCPPYLIYVDRDAREVVLAMRGLNLVRESDYKVLMDNRLGMQMFDGGYVHHGLLKAAVWVLERESDMLKSLWVGTGSCYKMVFAGHSLGSGVVALMGVVAVNHRNKLGGVPRELLKCYAMAPARCMSLNLAVKYADVIYSVVLQDDFLPRTPTPLEDIFRSIFCLPCLMFLVCLRDTFIPESGKLRDPRRLYAPGRIYHIVERKFCRCGRFPPEVRTAIPVEGRFEHIVLSCNATSDHGIVWIEREAQKAVERLKERAEGTTAPPIQKMERKQSMEKEHKDALERAVSLNVPHAVAPSESATEESHKTPPPEKQVEGASHGRSRSSGTNWDELVEKLFEKNASGNLVLKKDVGK